MAASSDSDQPSTSSQSLNNSIRTNNTSDDGHISPGPTILDYSHTGMDTSAFAEALSNQPESVFSSVESILATNNLILELPDILGKYRNLKLLDISNNQISDIPEVIVECHDLTTLISRNNLLDEHSLPKQFKYLTRLREINFSGNNYARIPYEIMELPALKILHMGANRIEYISKDIGLIRKLEVLYLGGNQITEIPVEVGELKGLRVFVLADNRIEKLPNSICTLKQLKSLLLHRNQLTTLPVELIKLRNLTELSLRDNPLVHKFVRDMVYDPPTLMELSARTVKLRKIPYKRSDLPHNLVEYLSCAHQCVNPRCKGVFFDSRVEHIKFVDFCGKYRVPLLEYLCSPKCSNHRSPAYEASSDSDSDEDRMRKVLLG